MGSQEGHQGCWASTKLRSHWTLYLSRYGLRLSLGFASWSARWSTRSWTSLSVCFCQSHDTGWVCMHVQVFRISLWGHFFSLKCDPAHPWRLPTRKLKVEVERDCVILIWGQSWASGLAGSDRDAQPPVPTCGIGTQGLTLGREHGSSTLLKGLGKWSLLIRLINRSSLSTMLWVPWHLGCSFTLFCLGSNSMQKIHKCLLNWNKVEGWQNGHSNTQGFY